MRMAPERGAEYGGTFGGRAARTGGGGTEETGRPPGVVTQCGEQRAVAGVMEMDTKHAGPLSGASEGTPHSSTESGVRPLTFRIARACRLGDMMR